MKNGIEVTKELKSDTVTPTSLSKYGRQIFSVNDLSTKGKSPAILPSSKVEHQSSFGRNIRKTSEQTDFSYDTKDISQTKRTKATKSEPQTPSNKQKLLSTSEKKRSRKQLDIGLSPNLEDKLIKKSLIEQEITSSPASKRAKVETSSEMTKSPHLTSQKKSKRKDPATPIQGKMPSEISDQLEFSNTESIMASMNMPVDEDLVEAFPSQGNILIT